jgi:signal peptidase I
MTLTEESAQKIGQFANVRSVVPVIEPAGDWNKDMFPHDSNFRWNIDNYGPIAMPRKGETVALTPVNIVLYKRIIDVFEDNDLRIEGERIFINGKETRSYTFKMDYYWMMGDNRHNSADSRYWGFVPEDHIVGEAVFVWFSMDPRKSLFDGKIRFSKLWRIVN